MSNRSGLPPISADAAVRLAPGQGIVVHHKPLTVVVAPQGDVERTADAIGREVERLIESGDLSFGPVATGLQQFVIDHQPAGVAAVLDITPDPIAFLFDQAAAIGTGTVHRASGRAGWTTVFVEGDSVSLAAGAGPEQGVVGWSSLWAGVAPGQGAQVTLSRAYDPEAAGDGPDVAAEPAEPLPIEPTLTEATSTVALVAEDDPTDHDGGPAGSVAASADAAVEAAAVFVVAHPESTADTAATQPPADQAVPATADEALAIATPVEAATETIALEPSPEAEPTEDTDEATDHDGGTAEPTDEADPTEAADEDKGQAEPAAEDAHGTVDDPPSLDADALAEAGTAAIDGGAESSLDHTPDPVVTDPVGVEVDGEAAAIVEPVVDVATADGELAAEAVPDDPAAAEPTPATDEPAAVAAAEEPAALADAEPTAIAGEPPVPSDEDEPTTDHHEPADAEPTVTDGDPVSPSVWDEPAIEQGQPAEAGSILAPASESMPSGSMPAESMPAEPAPAEAEPVGAPAGVMATALDAADDTEPTRAKRSLRDGLASIMGQRRQRDSAEDPSDAYDLGEHAAMAAPPPNPPAEYVTSASPAPQPSMEPIAGPPPMPGQPPSPGAAPEPGPDPVPAATAMPEPITDLDRLPPPAAEPIAGPPPMPGQPPVPGSAPALDLRDYPPPSEPIAGPPPMPDPSQRATSPDDAE